MWIEFVVLNNVERRKWLKQHAKIKWKEGLNNGGIKI
jgi:hypothetical protein